MGKRSISISELIASINSRLSDFSVKYDGLTLREKVIALADATESMRKLGVAVVRANGIDERGARERLKMYFRAHIGVILDSRELEVVAGISEYGRRIRELRVQDGFSILTGNSSDPESGIELSPTQYLLLRPDQDLEAAHRWAVANRIRKDKSIGGRERLLLYFKENVGKVVTGEELYYVCSQTDFPRRTRELRSEFGYTIATHFTGRPDLKPGEYVLESAEPTAEERVRAIPDAILRRVYQRDQNQCRNCSWSRQQWRQDDPRYLEVHHLEHFVAGGSHDEANLLVLCNVCHDGIHAGDITLGLG